MTFAVWRSDAPDQAVFVSEDHDAAWRAFTRVATEIKPRGLWLFGWRIEDGYYLPAVEYRGTGAAACAAGRRARVTAIRKGTA